MAKHVTHGTTVANTVATKTLDGDYFRSVVVINRDGAGELFVRTDGTNPVVGADESYCVPAGVGATVEIPVGGPTSGTAPRTVKLISTAAVKFTVMGGAG